MLELDELDEVDVLLFEEEVDEDELEELDGAPPPCDELGDCVATATELSPEEWSFSKLLAKKVAPMRATAPTIDAVTTEMKAR